MVQPRIPAGFSTHCCISCWSKRVRHFLVWHFFIRKTGHFVGYFTLSLLLFRAWRATFPFPGASWTIQWARISFFMTALVASLDEWHQTYLPKRTGTVHDVLLDSTAALVAQILSFRYFASSQAGAGLLAESRTKLVQGLQKTEG